MRAYRPFVSCSSRSAGPLRQLRRAVRPGHVLARGGRDVGQRAHREGDSHNIRPLFSPSRKIGQQKVA